MIKNDIKTWFRVILVMLVIAGMPGCSLFDRNPDRSPTSPNIQSDVSDVDVLGNFIANNSVSNAFKVFLTASGFKVNIPSPGDYVITYVIKGGKTYNFVFRVRTPSLVAIGKRGEVKSILIQGGTVKSGARPVSRSGAVQLFNWPTRPWKHLFVASTVQVALPLSGAGISSLPPTAGPVVIATLGNSITYGLGSSRGGYPAYLEATLLKAGHDVNVVNKGIPGDWAYETSAIFRRATQGADAVLLMIGTNDIVHGDCHGRRCNLIGHIEDMIDKASSQGIPIILSTIIAANTTDIYAHINDEILNANKQIKALAASKGVRVVDNYSAFRRNGGNRLYDDRLHPNDRGYKIMADVWYRGIRNLAFLKP